MAVKVIKLEAAYPGSHYQSPHSRACMLAHAGVDYLRAVTFVVENTDQGPMTSFLLPSMHQTLELLMKAVAFKADPAFDPKKHSHRLANLLRHYAGRVPIFASMLSRSDTVTLLEGLEKGYLGVRYGECVWSCDGEDWRLFLRLAEELLDELHILTQLKFLAKHFEAATGK